MTDSLKLAEISELGFYKKSANGSWTWNKCDEGAMLIEFYRRHSGKILKEAERMGIAKRMPILELHDKISDKSKKPQYFDVSGVSVTPEDEVKGVAFVLQTQIEAAYKNLPDKKSTRELWLLHTFHTFYDAISEEIRGAMLPEYKSVIDKFIAQTKTDYPAYYSEAPPVLSKDMSDLVSGHEESSNIITGRLLKMMAEQALEQTLIEKNRILPDIAASPDSPDSPDSPVPRGGSRKASWAHSKAALSSQKTQWRQTKRFQQQQRREGLRTEKDLKPIFAQAARRLQQLENECKWGPKNDAEMGVYFGRLFPGGEIRSIFPDVSFDDLFRGNGPLSYKNVMYVVDTVVAPVVRHVPRMSRGMMLLLAIMWFFQGVGASNVSALQQSNRGRAVQSWTPSTRWPLVGTSDRTPQRFVEGLLPLIPSAPVVGHASTVGQVAVVEPKGASYLIQASAPIRTYLASNPSLRDFILQEQLKSLFTGVFSGQATEIHSPAEFTNFLDIRRALKSEPVKEIIPLVPVLPDPPAVRPRKPTASLTAEECSEISGKLLDDEARSLMATSRPALQGEFVNEIKSNFPAYLRTSTTPEQAKYISTWTWIKTAVKDTRTSLLIIPKQYEQVFESAFFEFVKDRAKVAIEARGNTIYKDEIKLRQNALNAAHARTLRHLDALNSTAETRATAAATANQLRLQGEANGVYNLEYAQWLRDTDVLLKAEIGTPLRWDQPELTEIIGEVQVGNVGSKITNIHVLVKKVSYSEGVKDWLFKNLFGAAESTGAVAPSMIRIHFTNKKGEKFYTIIDVSKPAQMEILRPFAIHNIVGSVTQRGALNLGIGEYLLTEDSKTMLSVFDIINMGSGSSGSSSSAAITSSMGRISWRLMAEGTKNRAEKIISENKKVLAALENPSSLGLISAQMSTVPPELMIAAKDGLKQYTLALELAAERIYQPAGAGGIVPPATREEEAQLMQDLGNALQAAGADKGVIALVTDTMKTVSSVLSGAAARGGRIATTLANAGESAVNSLAATFDILTSTSAVSGYVCTIAFSLITKYNTAFGLGHGLLGAILTGYFSKAVDSKQALFATPFISVLLILSHMYLMGSAPGATKLLQGAPRPQPAIAPRSRGQPPPVRGAPLRQYDMDVVEEEDEASAPLPSARPNAVQRVVAPPPQQAAPPQQAQAPQQPAAQQPVTYQPGALFGGTRKRKSNKRKSSKRKSRRA